MSVLSQYFPSFFLLGEIPNAARGNSRRVDDPEAGG